MPYPRIIIPLVLLALIAWGSLFIVNERQKALLLRFGEIVEADYEPGLHVKLPLINQVRLFDARLLNLDTEPERFLTSEKKDVIVDYFVRWRIEDVEQYFVATRGDERRAALLLAQKINAQLRNEFGKRTVQEVVSGERGAIMNIVTDSSREQANELGVNIEDVRVSRIDLPEEVSTSVYQRMRAERERVARDFRSRGAEAAERIRADADRERTVILAEAFNEAERLRGEGDAVAADVYAQAYSKNEEFYSLYRSLGAYRKSFEASGNMLLIEPDSDFFRYFKDATPGGE